MLNAYEGRLKFLEGVANNSAVRTGLGRGLLNIQVEKK